MLKMDKRRGRSVEFLEDMFKDDVEFMSANRGESLEDSTIEDDFKMNDDKFMNPTVLVERIGDGGDDKEICPTQLIRTTSRTTKVFNIQQSQRTQYDKMTTKYLVMKDNDKVAGATSNNQLNPIDKHVKNSAEELLYDDHEENVLDGFDDSKTDDKQEALLVSKSNSECSMDMGYINDDDKNQVGASDIINDTNECRLNDEENSNVNETDHTAGLQKTMENEKISPNSVEEQEQETDELFYIIEEPVIKEEESIFQQNVEDGVDVEENADAETESTMQLIEDLTDADGCDEGEEPVYESSETNRSVVQMEEYLIDESDTGSVAQQEVESTEELAMKRPSTTTFKIRDREHRGSPHSRRKGYVSYMFSCDVCGNHFTNRSLRNYHMRIHRKEKNFECE